jgi:hypothetical protein
MNIVEIENSGYGAETGVPDQYGTDYEDRIWSHKWEMWTGSWTSSDGVTGKSSLFTFRPDSFDLGLLRSDSSEGIEIAFCGICCILKITQLCTC